MGLLSETSEIDVFKSQVVLDLLNFKWAKYGSAHHIVGLAAHLFYALVFCLYI
jgi:hypothetical protein